MVNHEKNENFFWFWAWSYWCNKKIKLCLVVSIDFVGAETFSFTAAWVSQIFSMTDSRFRAFFGCIVYLGFRPIMYLCPTPPHLPKAYPPPRSCPQSQSPRSAASAAWCSSWKWRRLQRGGAGPSPGGWAGTARAARSSLGSLFAASTFRLDERTKEGQGG